MLSCASVLYEKYPFLMRYFENGVKNPDKNIAHCILFYGNDIQAQYELALEIARMLNCTGTHLPDCNCLNCNWIRENKHPAVITISKVDNKPSDDTSKTVISIDQARMIKNDLLVTSEYHRVLIFCDRDDDGNVCGLNQNNFQEPTANALLKTFEEPPQNTTFFFLTKDKSDMISTIISRAQSFFVPSKLEENREFSYVRDLMNDYLDIERNQVLDFNDDILKLIQEYGALEIFTQMQVYLEEMLKSNIYNQHLKIKLIEDLKILEKAKRQLQLNMNIQTIVENLAFDLILK